MQRKITYKDKTRLVGTIILTVTFLLGVLAGHAIEKTETDRLKQELSVWRKREPILKKLFANNSELVKQALLLEEDLLRFHDHTMLVNHKLRQVNLVQQKADNKYRKEIGIPEKEISPSGLYDPRKEVRDILEKEGK